MKSDIKTHYGGPPDLAVRIKQGLTAAGKDIEQLRTVDLAAVDEFHIRGRKATLELAERMELTPDSHVLDIGCGLGGAARAVAETYQCRVTGIDLSQNLCETATALSEWVDLADKVDFVQGDATDLHFDPASFDAAMTIHAAMNIAAKDAVYADAKQVLKPGHVFAVYDVLQGEGGPVVFPVPWARDASISHLATPEEMRKLLTEAGFEVEDEIDSTDESGAWFKAMAERMATSGPPPVSFQVFIGNDFPQMARNQVQNLTEKRIRTVTYICRA